MSKLKDRLTSVESEIFEKVFELAEIEQLTKKDMEKYKKSVLKYYDVQDAMSCARKEGRTEDRKEGHENEKINIIQKCLQKKIAREDIIFLIGYSKEQINRYSINGTL